MAAGGVARRLLVAEAVELDALALGENGDGDHGDAHDPEHVLHALLLQAAGDDLCAGHLGHGSLSPLL